MNATISFEVDEKVKKQAQRVADKKGTDLNVVLGMYLTQFAQGQVDLADDESYDNLKDSVKGDIAQAQKEYYNGKIKSFASPEESVRFLKDLIKT